jgi:hypothetical protein
MKMMGAFRRNLAIWALFSGGIFCSAVADPNIFSVEGDVVHGGQLTIEGSGFGAKNPAQPLFWAPMDSTAEPSDLGLLRTWGNLGDMEYAPGEGPAGSGALKAISNSGKWTASINSTDFFWNDPGLRMYIFRKLKRNFDIFDNPPGINGNDGPTINWKTWRVWGEEYKSYSTLGIWNGHLSTQGHTGTLSPGHNKYPGLEPRRAAGPVGEWFTNEILTRSNTSSSNNGFWRYIVNGRVESSLDSYQMWDDQNPPDFRINYVVHEVKANATFPEHWRSWASDVYVDTTWARVLISESSDFEDAGSREIQIPISWGNNRIEIVVNTHAHPTGSPMYLFVVDEFNRVSAPFLLEGKNPIPPEEVGVE